MAAIYGLFTDQFCWYVGSTTSWIKRLRNHNCRKDKGIGADLIPRDYEFEMRKLEDCTVGSRYTRERHYYETLKPILNIIVPARGRNERQRENRSIIKEEYNAAQREYYTQNKEIWLERQRQRRLECRDQINARRRELYAAKKLNTKDNA